jgi:hypothetical protein
MSREKSTHIQSLFTGGRSAEIVCFAMCSAKLTVPELHCTDHVCLCKLHGTGASGEGSRGLCEAHDICINTMFAFANFRAEGLQERGSGGCVNLTTRAQTPNPNIWLQAELGAGQRALHLADEEPQ